MQHVINILTSYSQTLSSIMHMKAHTWKINSAHDQPLPLWESFGLWWDNPVLVLDRQAIENGLSKQMVGDLEFVEETLLLGLLALCLAECADEVAGRVVRGGVPSVNHDEDLLAKENGSLESVDLDVGEQHGKDGWEGEACSVG